MKMIILVISLSIIWNTLAGQTIGTNHPNNDSLLFKGSLQNLLNEISENNMRLLALKELTEAQKISNRTGLNPKNPEVEFNYLYGQQPLTGNRKDLKIIQSFDFPTSYIYKSQVANLKNKQSDYEFRKEYLSVMQSARLLYIDLIYQNAYIQELNTWLEHARKLSDSYESRFKKGDANILEYNKAFLNLASQQRLLNDHNIQRQKILSEIVSLNGGEGISIPDTNAYLPQIEPDFEKWYLSIKNSNPDILWMQQEAEINSRMVKLNSSLALPKLTAGYMSESLPDEQFKGVTVGISIPLWENKNIVSSSKKKSLASQNLYLDLQKQFYLSLKAAHEKALSLIENAKNYRSGIQSHTNAEFLKKAFEAGEISLIDYITELSYYYQNVDNLLILEHDAGVAAAELLYYQ